MPLMPETITLTYDLLRRLDIINSHQAESRTHAPQPVATFRVTVKPEYVPTKPEPKP